MALLHMLHHGICQSQKRGEPLAAQMRLAVFNYWRSKRLRVGRPLLRRLQAPTPSTDSNPHHVFRRGPPLCFLHPYSLPWTCLCVQAVSPDCNCTFKNWQGDLHHRADRVSTHTGL